MLIENKKKKKKGPRTKAADVCDLDVVNVYLSRRTCVIRQLKLFFQCGGVRSRIRAKQIL